MKSSTINYVTNARQRYAVCILALFVLAMLPAYATQVTSGVSFAQISFTDPAASQEYSHYGLVSVDYTMLFGDGYINVERYDNGTAVGWVVKNLQIPNGSVLPTSSSRFDLGASGYQSSFSAYVDFSPIPLTDDNSLKNQVPMTYLLAQAEEPPAKEYDVSFEKKKCDNPTKIRTLGLAYPLPALNKGKTDGCFINDLDEDKTKNIITQLDLQPNDFLDDIPTLGGPPFFYEHAWQTLLKGAKNPGAFFYPGKDKDGKPGPGIPKDNKTFIVHIKGFEGKATKVELFAFKVE